LDYAIRYSASYLLDRVLNKDRAMNRRLYSHPSQVVPQAPTTLSVPILRAALYVVFCLVTFLTALPSLYALIWAFAGSETIGVLSSRPSLAWFGTILGDPDWQRSLAYSTVVALLASTAGALALLVHFYFMRYVTGAVDRIAYATLLPVLLVPSVVYALALRQLGASPSIPESLLLFIGHCVLVLPLQFYVFESAQEGVPSSLLFAGSTLGASHFGNMWGVFWPTMRQTFFSAALVGFFGSFDELVVATFVLDSPLVTVPRRLWNQVDHNMDPAPAVVSVLLLTLYVVASAIRLLFIRVVSDREDSHAGL
jgi:ABC-type spermidine/putrescine transport system permease subunit II